MQLTQQVLEPFRVMFRELTERRFISEQSVSAAKKIQTLKILNHFFWPRGGGGVFWGR